MAVTLTVTGKAGPGNTVTAQVFNNARAWHQDCIQNILTIEQSDGKMIAIAIDDATTYTVTKSGSTYTVTVS